LILLDRLTRQTGKNMILVTHSQEAASYADRNQFLRGGRLIEGGPKGCMCAENINWLPRTEQPKSASGVSIKNLVCLTLVCRNHSSIYLTHVNRQPKTL